MDVTLPNGTVIQGIPEGTPKEEIQRKAIAGGFAVAEDFPSEEVPGLETLQEDIQTYLQDEDKGLIDRLGEAFTGEERMTPEIEGLPDLGEAPEFNEMSLRAFKANIGTFATGKPEDLKAIFKEQYGDDVSFTQDSKGNEIVNFPSGSYPLNRPGFSGQDIPKLVGDLSLFGKFGVGKTILGTAGKSAGVEAALEGVESAVGGEFTPKDVAEAGVFGGAFKSAESLLGAAWRALKGTAPAEAKELLKAADDAGIPIQTTDILPPKTFPGKAAQQTAEKIPLVGTGAARETQQVARQEAVDIVSQKYGEFSYKAIVDSLKTQKNKIKKAAGSVLEATGNKLDDFGKIDLINTVGSIKLAAAELKKPGVIKSGKGLDDLRELVGALKEAPQTYTTLKENRTAFREIVKSLDPTSRSQLTSRAKSLLERVESGMTKDMKSFAKENLTPQEFSKLNKANATYAEEAAKLTKTKLKNVLDKGDFTPESVKSMIFSQNPSEMKTLYNSLSQVGRENARAAVISKITTDLGKRQSGFTPNSFATELKKYEPQIKTFFKGKERRQLEGLRRVLESTRRAQDASATTITGQQMIAPAFGYAAFTDLGVTLGLSGSIGGLARLYESAPVRNALLKLGSTQKGSSSFERALSEASRALNAGAQSLRDQGKETQTQE